MNSNTSRVCRAAQMLSAAAILVFAAAAVAGDGTGKQYRGRLGNNNKRVMVKDGKTLLWADGDPDKEEHQTNDDSRFHHPSPFPAAARLF